MSTPRIASMSHLDRSHARRPAGGVIAGLCLGLVVPLALVATSAQARGAELPQLQGALTLTSAATIEVTKDLLSITFNATREGNDASAVQLQLKQALDNAL